MNKINRGRINTVATALAENFIVFIRPDSNGDMVFFGRQVSIPKVSSRSCIGSNGYGAEFNQVIRDCLEMMD